MLLVAPSWKRRPILWHSNYVKPSGLRLDCFGRAGVAAVSKAQDSPAATHPVAVAESFAKCAFDVPDEESVARRW